LRDWIVRTTRSIPIYSTLDHNIVMILRALYVGTHVLILSSVSVSVSAFTTSTHSYNSPRHNPNGRKHHLPLNFDRVGVGLGLGLGPESAGPTGRRAAAASAILLMSAAAAAEPQQEGDERSQHDNEHENGNDNEYDNDFGPYTARALLDNDLELSENDEGRVIALPKNEDTDGTLPAVVDETEQRIATDKQEQQQQQQPAVRANKPKITEPPATVVPLSGGFNVVLTHATADFDSLASAVGLAKLWSAESLANTNSNTTNTADANAAFDSASHFPTFVVLPRGAHPAVQKFLSLHKHLFPIRSLKSLPSDLSGLNRLALCDAQRRDRLGPAENLLQYAKRITVVDHHIDQDSDIPATDYVVDHVGSVSTMIAERLMKAEHNVHVTEAESTLLALGIHADTGSLTFDSTTPRDAMALAWCLSQGASQTAIAEHAHNSLSAEQQGVLTQALINANSTVVHGVTVSTVLLSADGFIGGLAAVTHDALELSSSDVFLLGLVYEAKSGGRRRSHGKGKGKGLLTSRLLTKDKSEASPGAAAAAAASQSGGGGGVALVNTIMHAEAWQGGEEALRRRRLRTAFDRKDTDGLGYLAESDIAAAAASSGIIASGDSVTSLMDSMDTDGKGRIDFEEFVVFATDAEKRQEEENNRMGRRSTTMIIIGRVKAGVSTKTVKLNKMLERFGGGGHVKAASATVRLNKEEEAEGIMQDLVDELIETSLQEQVSVVSLRESSLARRVL
jgi:nanoRNase/pAp phosphatase (c-di-AMP/oligoRNAs hydrolase)